MSSRRVKPTPVKCNKLCELTLGSGARKCPCDRVDCNLYIQSMCYAKGHCAEGHNTDAQVDDDVLLPGAKRQRSIPENKSAKQSFPGRPKRQKLSDGNAKKQKKVSSAPPMFWKGKLINMSPPSSPEGGVTTFLTSAFRSAIAATQLSESDSEDETILAKVKECLQIEKDKKRRRGHGDNSRTTDVGHDDNIAVDHAAEQQMDGCGSHGDNSTRMEVIGSDNNIDVDDAAAGGCVLSNHGDNIAVENAAEQQKAGCGSHGDNSTRMEVIGSDSNIDEDDTAAGGCVLRHGDNIAVDVGRVDNIAVDHAAEQQKAGCGRHGDNSTRAEVIGIDNNIDEDDTAAGGCVFSHGENIVEKLLASRDQAVNAVLVKDRNREDEHIFNASVEKFDGVLWRPSTSNGVKVYRQLTVSDVAKVTLGDVFDREDKFLHFMGSIYNSETERVEVHCALYDKKRNTYVQDASILSVQNTVDLFHGTKKLFSLKEFCDQSEGVFEFSKLESQLKKKIKAYGFIKRRGRSRQSCTGGSMGNNPALNPPIPPSASAAPTPVSSAIESSTSKPKQKITKPKKPAAAKPTKVVVAPKGSSGGATGKQSNSKSTTKVPAVVQPVVQPAEMTHCFPCTHKVEISEWDKHKMEMEREDSRRQHAAEIHSRTVEHQKLIHKTALDMAVVLTGRINTEKVDARVDSSSMSDYSVVIPTTTAPIKRTLMACIKLILEELPIAQEGQAADIIENALLFIGDDNIRIQCQEMESNLQRANYIVLHGLGIE